MKVLLFCWVILGLSIPLAAQPIRQDTADNAQHLSRLAKEVAALRASTRSLQNEVSMAGGEIGKLKASQPRIKPELINNGVRAEVQAMATRITEVDRKREADKQVISREFKRSVGKLELALTRHVEAAARASAKPAPAAEVTRPTKTVSKAASPPPSHPAKKPAHSVKKLKARTARR